MKLYLFSTKTQIIGSCVAESTEIAKEYLKCLKSDNVKALEDKIKQIELAVKASKEGLDNHIEKMKPQNGDSSEEICNREIAIEEAKRSFDEYKSICEKDIERCNVSIKSLDGEIYCLIQEMGNVEAVLG